MGNSAIRERGQRQPNALRINDVLGKKVPFNENIKNAPEIDGSRELNLISTAFQTVDGKYNETFPIAEAIKKRLESTNSKRYATGEEAQKHIQELQEVIDDMKALSEKLHGLDTMPSADGLYNHYNEELKLLKQAVDLKRLKEIADDINSHAKGGDGLLSSQRVYDTRTDGNRTPSSGEQDGGKTWQYVKPLGSYTAESPYGGEQTYYRYELIKFKYIKYWTFLNINWDWPFQMNSNTVEKMINIYNQAGVDPYQYISDLNR